MKIREEGETIEPRVKEWQRRGERQEKGSDGGRGGTEQFFPGLKSQSENKSRVLQKLGADDAAGKIHAGSADNPTASSLAATRKGATPH